jgi:membrane-bound metal-dependent hydrolase YbcI (DUF457 family)
MSLPILHSIVGASLVALCYRRNSLAKDWRFLLIGALIAVIPDFDYLLVYGLDMSHESHRSFTHSIFFSLAVTLLALIVTRFSCIKRTVVCGLALISHGILDFLITSATGGVKLLYPLSDKRLEFEMIVYSSEWTILCSNLLIKPHLK